MLFHRHFLHLYEVFLVLSDFEKLVYVYGMQISRIDVTKILVSQAY